MDPPPLLQSSTPSNDFYSFFPNRIADHPKYRRGVCPPGNPRVRGFPKHPKIYVFIYSYGIDQGSPTCGPTFLLIQQINRCFDNSWWAHLNFRKSTRRRTSETYYLRSFSLKLSSTRRTTRSKTVTIEPDCENCTPRCQRTRFEIPKYAFNTHTPSGKTLRTDCFGRGFFSSGKIVRVYGEYANSTRNSTE